MRLISNVLTGMDVCLDSAPAGSKFSAITVGETETCKPYLGHFCQVYFCARVNERRKIYIYIYIYIYIVSPNCSPQMLLCVYFLCLHAKWLQSCLTLCNPVDCCPPGFSVHGILQARILEWVAVPSSRGSSQPRDRTCVSYISCTGRQVLYH